jgi:hypothetical protein
MESVKEILSKASLYSDGRDYVFVRLPAQAITAAAGVVAELGEPFCGLVIDKDEVSLILPEEAWKDFSNRLPGHTTAESLYRLITIDTPLDMNLVGFMAYVSRALADAKVPILPLAAYTRDHILVPVNQIDAAMTALQKLRSGD